MPGKHFAATIAITNHPRLKLLLLLLSMLLLM